MAYNETNTGERFISKTINRVKVHVPMPDGTIWEKSLSYREGEYESTLATMLEVRNLVGQENWISHWPLMLENYKFLKNLPVLNFTPTAVIKYTTLSDGGVTSSPNLFAKKCVNGKTKSILRSVDKHGLFSAYRQVQEWIQEMYAEEIPVLLYTGKITKCDLSLTPSIEKRKALRKAISDKM